MRAPVLGGLALVALAAIGPTRSDAQRFPDFGGVEARVGVVLPDDARTGLSTAVDVDLGYVGIPLVRPILGFNHIQADVRDRRFDGGLRATGSLSAFGARAGTRVDFLDVAGVRPYVLAGITFHNVNVDAESQADRNLLDDIYGGFLVGASVGGGVGYALDRAQQFLGTAEVRRVWNANLPHWGAEIGIRIVPRGRGAYERVRVYRDPWQAEAERARAEQQRLLAQEERRRAEQERLARMTDEERRRLEQETLEARRLEERAAAERAEAEAAAARARREAERAREAAERAEREAAAVDARARETEELLYRSLLELERLIANVTDIRQTERGMTIVLGQGLFAVGQASLSPRARDEVQLIAGVLLQYPQYRIAVEGHTDSTGSMAMNMRLSEQRAMAVRAALVQYGIAPGRVEMTGHGPTLPIADNATAAGRAQNRRVEIVVLGAQRPIPGRTP